MFAVIETGGKQYKVKKDLIMKVEKLDAEKGSKVVIENVIALGGTSVVFGDPYVKGATVTAEVIDQIRGDKIIVFKKRRRHNYRRTNGHRQDLSVIKIVDIQQKKASAKESN
jgi:large subunit ribosomal protein L21